MKKIGLLAVFGLVLAGCGGGGGGGGNDPANSESLSSQCRAGSAAGSLRYSTSWGTVGDNASQFVRLLDRNGNVARTFVLNRAGASTGQQTETGIPPGYYEMRAELFAGANATGAKQGVARQIVGLCGVTVPVNTHASNPPASVAVAPSTFTLSAQTSESFVESAKDSAGRLVFVPVGATTWQVTGGIGTIGPDGWLQATTTGEGTVRALVAGGPGGAASVRVTSFPITRSKWTVLVYLNAASDLYSFSDLNMNQMEKVAGGDVRFVVQWKQSRDLFPASSFDGVRRYLVTPDSNENVLASRLLQSNMVDGAGRALDMGSTQTLRDFIEWGKTNFPSDRTVLVLWSHGNGWRRAGDEELTRAYSIDDQYGTAIQVWDSDQAFSGHHFDIISFDASLMQMAEVAYELRGYADYITGSEESPPAEGLPYDAVFAAFKASPDASTRVLSKAFVDAMVNHPPFASRKITQSSVETARLNAVAVAMDNLAQALIDSRFDIADEVQEIRVTAQSYSRNANRFFYDIVDVCLKLEEKSTAPSGVRSAAAALRQAVTQAVAWEGHNANSPGSHGLSFDFSPADRFEPQRLDYARLKLAQDTRWDQWLQVAP